MNQRVQALRKKSMEATPSISGERARLVTEFAQQNEGKFSIPVMRALQFRNLCEKQEIFIDPQELIVGERGPFPKAVPTFPELTCHSLNDLAVLNSRPMTRYTVPNEVFALYENKVIPYWSGRSMRERVLPLLEEKWQRMYSAGLFTEFMEQRAPGHTCLDARIYHTGMLDLQAQIHRRLARLDPLSDPDYLQKREQLQAMSISCDAIITFAHRHRDLALERSQSCSDAQRSAEYLHIAQVCDRVPAHAPRTFHEALQMYWFVHLGTIMELNGWDSMNPGHLDQHLFPFYQQEVGNGILDREKALELLECFWIKFNNQPAPPKVGVTARESGTYNDFTNINIGGLTREGNDGVNEVSYLLLQVVDEIHLLQPGCNVQISQKSPERFLKQAVRLIAKGYGYPSVFNADAIVQELLFTGKTPEDAREGGASGCIETGAFGKEAYILTGYLNLPKVLEITLHDGVDPLTGETVGVSTGNPGSLESFEQLYHAFETQLDEVLHTKLCANHVLEQAYAQWMPAPFLSVLIEGCIESARDYNGGGAKYNTRYIQCCGLGTVTDSLSALRTHVFEEHRLELEALVQMLGRDFEGNEAVRGMLRNKTPFFGNDEAQADELMKRVFDTLFQRVDGQGGARGSVYHLDFLSTTCHVYFGQKTGATPDGRKALLPISDGTSPSQGADRNGPAAVIRSLSKMDQLKTGGTLLNQRFSPALLQEEKGIDSLCQLVRSYFCQGGHHVQCNVVDTKTLREAQQHPEDYADLLVRVAGYSDYFVHLDKHHQEEIISRTVQQGF